MKKKYDIWGENSDGEEMILPVGYHLQLTTNQRRQLVDGDVIFNADKSAKFWAEEAMNYVSGVYL